MRPEKLKDYYKVLNSELTDSEWEIFKKFKALVKESHPEFAGDSKTEQFKLQNEAWYILSFEPERKIYDKEYKNLILFNSDESPSVKELQILNVSIIKSKELAREYSKLSFKQFWKKVRKKESLLKQIFDGITDFIATV